MTPPPIPSEEHSSRHDAIAALFVTEPYETWLPTFTSLAAAEPELRIVVGAASAETCSALTAHLPAETDIRHLASSSRLVEQLRAEQRSHILLIWAPALFPEDFLGPALQLVREDLRFGSVSFLSNVAGYAGFPLQDVINTHQVGDMDEISVTRKLRTAPFSFGAVPLAYPVGPAVLFSSQGLSLLTQFPDHGNSAWVAIAECGIRLRARGMVDLLDPSTFISRPLDMTDPYPHDAGLGDPEWQWLNLRGPGLMRLPLEASEQHAPFREALAWARSEVFGMRIIIDASCLGPKEMGTQVALLALVEALAERDEVEYLGVAIPGAVPAYAVDVLAHPKVDARLAPDGDLVAFPHVDIIHCPFQTPDVDLDMWRTKGRRTLVTLHDLIAFQTPAYFNVSEHWFEYRQGIRERASFRRWRSGELRGGADPDPTGTARHRRGSTLRRPFGHRTPPGRRAHTPPRGTARTRLRRDAVHPGARRQLQPQEPRHRRTRRGGTPEARAADLIGPGGRAGPFRVFDDAPKSRLVCRTSGRS